MTGLGRSPAPIAVVDDNVHSARLLLRTLAAHGGRARWLGNAERAGRTLECIFLGRTEAPPRLIVVDLKSRTGASADFVARFYLRARAHGTRLVTMEPSLASEYRRRALLAGAAAVFQRHSERADYDREIEALINFWEREERPEQVGS